MKKVASRFDGYEPITIKCPHCGKKMVLADKKSWKRRTFEWDYHDEDYWVTHDSESCACPTFKCESCGITAVHLNSTADVDLDTVKGDVIQIYDEHSTSAYDYHFIEFIFPKNFEKTITQKQSNYISFLCQKYGYTKPYFTDINLASAWISKHVDKSKLTDFNEKVKELIVAEMGRHGYERKNNDSTFYPRTDDQLNRDYEYLKERNPDWFKVRCSGSRTRNYSIQHKIIVNFDKKTTELNYHIAESNFDIDEMMTRLKPELKDINDEFREIGKAIDDIWTEADKQLAAGNFSWKQPAYNGYYL